MTELVAADYTCAMRSVDIRALRRELGRYLRLAAEGETVLVTNRDRVVAEIGPPRDTRSPVLADATLAEAVRKGWITPARSPGSEPPPGGPPVATLDQLLQELEADRADRHAYDEPRGRAKANNLHELLSGSPLSQLDFEQDRVCSPVRDVRLCEQEEVRDEP